MDLYSVTLLIALLLAGAALATAAVLYVLDLRQPSESVALVPVVTAQSTGLAARMAF